MQGCLNCQEVLYSPEAAPSPTPLLRETRIPPTKQPEIDGSGNPTNVQPMGLGGDMLYAWVGKTVQQVPQ
jgi:hypothetical protein